MTRTGLLLLALTASTALVAPAMAQPAPSSKSPVAFTADTVSYDKTGNVVTASGHVRAVQDGQTLSADSVKLDRNTDVVTAIGHVVLTQADGNTVYAQHAVLTKGMKNAVMQGVAARLAQNARLIANGGARYNGQIDELSKVVYSACNLCVTNPRAAPTWQIRARTATRDLQHRMIEYRDAMLEMYGVPVFYTPFLTMPDPSVKRQSGLLIPSIGSTSRLGFFFTVPYYFTLGPTADITLTPIIAVKQGPALKADYREAFNDGVININLSGGDVRQGDQGFGNSVFASGTFDLNQDWRAGFNYNHASNPTYLQDFSIAPLVAELMSNVYLEGFSQGSYARLEAETFQGLVVSVNQSEVPIVLPHGEYSYLSGQDGWGGQLSLNADAFDVMRHVGTNTRRVVVEPGYQLPVALPYGIVGTARVRLVAAGYNASHMYEQPNYVTGADGTSVARAEPYGALMLRWPFVRPGGAWGSQLIEPEMQLVAAPEVGISQNNKIPNEDSLDLEFSDANLFDLNRYPGIDRMDGGERVDYALHSAWYLPTGAVLDGLIGQSYRAHKDNNYLPDSGLTGNVSDIVARATLAPVSWFNLSYRTRLSHEDLGARMIDATATVGTPRLNLSGGYLYTNTNPYALYDTPSSTGQLTLNPPASYFVPRREVTAQLSTAYGPWSVTAGVQRNLQTGQFDNASFTGTWQNDCFGMSLLYAERFTSFNLDTGSTLVLFQLTFKTLGTFGFNTL
jgi:LPS-assembly protein